MDPITELKSIRDQLANFTKSVQPGDSVPAEKAVQIDALIARSAELTAIIQNQKAAGDRLKEAAGESTWDSDGITPPANNAKGFLTPEALKQSIHASLPGVKSSLVSAGSSAIQTTLSPAPIQDGSTSIGLGLLSLLPTTVRRSPKYTFLVQDATNQDNNAAKVPTGGTKPVSVFGAKSVDNQLDVFAHLTEPIDKYLLEDNDQLELFLSAQMANGLLQVVTASLLADITAAATGTQAYVSTPADTIYEAIKTVAVGGMGTASLIVLHPDDYSAIRLSKETGTGAYLGGGPFEGSGNTGLWGIRTFVTPGQTKGSALVLDTSAVGISTDGKGIRVDWDKSAGFATNEVVGRFEGRWAADVFLPGRVVKADLTA
ncbi:hypothetical protein AB3M83_07615 [Microbacterium sp. 179-B 1A2 NHS]|uniref:hypothetical protein n=1 Tax=Microbacterium sp. 179-B 1A2 NHS TaxID=3142383 RepID=UPI0039A179FF